MFGYLLGNPTVEQVVLQVGAMCLASALLAVVVAWWWDD